MQTMLPYAVILHFSSYYDSINRENSDHTRT